MRRGRQARLRAGTLLPWTTAPFGYRLDPERPRRGRNIELPECQTPFTADGVVYTGNFAKIALNVAHRAGQPHNVLTDLLGSWFGADAAQPGTLQYVELVPGEPHWQMRPASPVADRSESVG
ncbi:MAG TPA: hypothetical protein VEH31_10690 [Streptosporangiaceae bacterium]|nr:hypothetical protein [Streptosporangiaceae bacterium]